jgi:hypothetical protein
MWTLVGTLEDVSAVTWTCMWSAGYSTKEAALINGSTAVVVDTAAKRVSGSLTVPASRFEKGQGVVVVVSCTDPFGRSATGQSASFHVTTSRVVVRGVPGVQLIVDGVPAPPTEVRPTVCAAVGLVGASRNVAAGWLIDTVAASALRVSWAGVFGASVASPVIASFTVDIRAGSDYSIKQLQCNAPCDHLDFPAAEIASGAAAAGDAECVRGVLTARVTAVYSSSGVDTEVATSSDFMVDSTAPSIAVECRAAVAAATRVQFCDAPSASSSQCDPVGAVFVDSPVAARFTSAFGCWFDAESGMHSVRWRAELVRKPSAATAAGTPLTTGFEVAALHALMLIATPAATLSSSATLVPGDAIRVQHYGVNRLVCAATSPLTSQSLPVVEPLLSGVDITFHLASRAMAVTWNTTLFGIAADAPLLPSFASFSVSLGPVDAPSMFTSIVAAVSGSTSSPYRTSFSLTRQAVVDLTGTQLFATVRSSVLHRLLSVTSRALMVDVVPPEVSAGSVSIVTTASPTSDTVPLDGVEISLPTAAVFVASGASSFDLQLQWIATDAPAMRVSSVTITVVSRVPATPTSTPEDAVDTVVWEGTVDINALTSFRSMASASRTPSCIPSVCVWLLGWSKPYGMVFHTTLRGVPAVPHLSHLLASVVVVDSAGTRSATISSLPSSVVRGDVVWAASLTVLPSDVDAATAKAAADCGTACVTSSNDTVCGAWSVSPWVCSLAVAQTLLVQSLAPGSTLTSPQWNTIARTDNIAADADKECVRGAALIAGEVYRLCISASLVADGGAAPASAAQLCARFRVDLSPPSVDASAPRAFGPVWDLRLPTVVACAFPSFVDDGTPSAALVWSTVVIAVDSNTVLVAANGVGVVSNVMVPDAALLPLLTRSVAWSSTAQSMALLECRVSVTDGAGRRTTVSSRAVSALELAPCSYNDAIVRLTSSGANFLDTSGQVVAGGAMVTLDDSLNVTVTAAMVASLECTRRVQHAIDGDVGVSTQSARVCVVPAAAAAAAAASDALPALWSSCLSSPVSSGRIGDATATVSLVEPQPSMWQVQLVATVTPQMLRASATAGPLADTTVALLLSGISLLGSTRVYVSHTFELTPHAAPVVDANAIVDACDESSVSASVQSVLTTSASLRRRWSVCAWQKSALSAWRRDPISESFFQQRPEDAVYVASREDADAAQLMLRVTGFSDAACGSSCLSYNATITLPSGAGVRESCSTSLVAAKAITVLSEYGIAFLRLPPIPWCPSDGTSKTLRIRVFATSGASLRTSGIITRTVVLLRRRPAVTPGSASATVAVRYDGNAQQLVFSAPSLVDASGSSRLLYFVSAGTDANGAGESVLQTRCLGADVSSGSVSAAEARLFFGNLMYLTVSAVDRSGQSVQLTSRFVADDTAPIASRVAATRCALLTKITAGSAPSVCAAAPAVSDAGISTSRSSASTTLTGCWINGATSGFVDAEESLVQGASAPNFGVKVRMLRRLDGPFSYSSVVAQADRDSDAMRWEAVSGWVAGTVQSSLDADGFETQVSSAQWALPLSQGEYRLQVQASNAAGLVTTAICGAALYVGELVPFACTPQMFTFPLFCAVVLPAPVTLLLRCKVNSAVIMLTSHCLCVVAVAL